MDKTGSPTSRVFSFDVFDTCITRCCDRPVDLFERLFTDLLAQQKISRYERKALAKSLARSRIAAETTARQQTTNDDVTLVAIYQVLEHTLAPYDISPTAAATAEIELELAAVSPILSTQQRIQQLRSQGSKIVFISDMYLPGDVVRQMLIDQGFSDGSDALYVSADVGLSKGSGRLFPHVCDQLGIATKQLHHTGDTRYADVRAARRQGVKATHFTDGNPNRYEQGFRAELIGDGWVRSHLIGLSRAVRLRHATDDSQNQTHAALAANVLAPLITGYLLWVLTVAQQLEIEHLYFSDKGLLAIAQAIIQSIHQQWPKQHEPYLPPDLPTCQLINEAKQTAKQTSDEAPGFMLCPAIKQAQIVSPQTDQLSSCLSYVESDIKPRKQLAGTAYLFERRAGIETLISVLSTSRPSIYQAIVADYIDSLLRWQHLSYSGSHTSEQTNSQPSLEPAYLAALKRYAINNAILLIAKPTPSEVQALLNLENNLDHNLDADNTSPWIDTWPEGANALSPFPVQTSRLALRQLRRIIKKIAS